jgi:hypothetical protein
MDKNQNVMVIVILFVVLITSLWMCYEYYNHDIDSSDYLIDIGNITCYPYTDTYKLCETDKIYSNGTTEIVGGLQKI